MTNNSWGSHSRSSFPNNKSVPKEVMKDLTSTQKREIKKMHKKKRRNNND
jgi:hypothetical protein